MLYILNIEEEEEKKNQFVIERNKKFAQILAKLLNIPFYGEYDFSKKINLKNDDLIFPFSSITPEQAKIIGIKHENQIYGSVAHKILTQKTIFHKLFDTEKYFPENFPQRFQESLSQANVVLPGYSVFDLDSLINAFKKLHSEKYVVRLKDPTASFGIKQSRITNFKDLESIIKTLDIESLKKHGMVLEANLVGVQEEKKVKTFSGGWIKLGGINYSYVGTQEINEALSPHKYLGTKIIMSRGDLKEIKNSIEETDFLEVIKILEILQKNFSKLPDMICTRHNFDIVKGRYEFIDGSYSDKYVFGVSDQGFSVGGATGAELLAKSQLDANPQLKVARASYKVNYGIKNDFISNKIITPFFLGKDVELGHIQAWGENN